MSSFRCDSATPWTISFVHRILQERILEWVVISSSEGDFPDPGVEPESLEAPALQAENYLPLSPFVMEVQAKTSMFLLCLVQFF